MNNKPLKAPTMTTHNSDPKLLPMTDDLRQLPAEQTPGYEAVRFNALKHGILSRYTVLSHENHADYESLVNSLMDEHLPAGATEQHLIEELASIIWRKRRVLQAEGATINRSLRGVVTSGVNSLIPASAPFEKGVSGEGADIGLMMRKTSDRVAEDQENAELELRAVWKARSILHKNGANAYANARRVLLPEPRYCWDKYVAEGAFQADAPSLATYIRDILEPVLNNMEMQARFQPAIKAQVLGEGLQAHKLEQLNRYETHLDRKFERTLAMLLKLKDLRSTKTV